MKKPLSGSAGHQELGAMVSSLTCDILLVLPKLHQKATQFWDRPVLLQGMQEVSMVQPVIGLTKVQ